MSASTAAAFRIIVRGRMTKRAPGKRVDYILYYKPNIPIAIVEAKDNNHRVGDGMQQALEYGEMIDVPFIFSSNGDAFLAHDSTGQSELVEREIALSEFPSPKELWRRYCKYKGLTPEIEGVVSQDYYLDPSGKVDRNGNPLPIRLHSRRTKPETCPYYM